MRKVIAVGQSCIDIVHVDYKPAMSYVGGRIANMAASLSRAGVPVEYVSECGQDSVGDMIVDFLQSNGVGTKSVDRFTEGLSPISLIFRDAEGRERYSEYVKYPKTRFDILWPKIEEDDIVVFGSYFSIDENVRKPLSEFLAYAQERKALLVYLPGFQPELCSRITRVMPYIFENLEMADIVIARESDMAKIFEKSDSKKCYDEHIRFYSRYFLFSNNQYDISLYADNAEIHRTAEAKPTNALGWNASVCAGFVYGLIQSGIGRESLAEGDWNRVADTAMDFAADSAKSGANVITTAFADSLGNDMR